MNKLIIHILFTNM